MAFLFWTLWVLDFLGTCLVLFTSQWRESMGAFNPFTSVHFWSLLVSILGLGGGLLFRYGLKMPKLALLFVALPWLALLIYYLIDRKHKGA
jgi:hypothetical protein